MDIYFRVDSNGNILASLKIHEDKEKTKDEVKISHVPTHSLQIGDIRTARYVVLHKHIILCRLEISELPCMWYHTHILFFADWRYQNCQVCGITYTYYSLSKGQ